MTSLLSTSLLATTVSSDVLVLAGALILLVSALVGFASGMFYERASAKRALTRAKKHLSQMVNMVVSSLESAHEACAALESFPNIVLSSKELKQLDAKQASLLDTVSRVMSSQQALAEAVTAEPKAKVESATETKPEPVEFAISWQRDDKTDAAGLPDRSAFDANLEMLLAAGNASEVDSGLLFIKIDKFDQLQSRFGSGGISTLLRKMSAVVCRAGRDEDLLCRYSNDTLAMLMPKVDAAAGRLLAQKIRDSVRSFHFRLEESGPEVFVSASYGVTVCAPADNGDLVVNRAGNAVSRSQRRGRNQLHLHDGETAVHCLAAERGIVKTCVLEELRKSGVSC